MNREAAALGVPVYTTYGGRLGGVDEELIRQGRLRPLTDPRALELDKRAAGGEERIRRDPAAAARAAALGPGTVSPLRRGAPPRSTSSPYRSSFVGPTHRRSRRARHERGRASRSARARDWGRRGRTPPRPRPGAPGASAVAAHVGGRGSPACPAAPRPSRRRSASFRPRGGRPPGRGPRRAPARPPHRDPRRSARAGRSERRAPPTVSAALDRRPHEDVVDRVREESRRRGRSRTAHAHGASAATLGRREKCRAAASRPGMAGRRPAGAPTPSSPRKRGSASAIHRRSAQAPRARVDPDVEETPLLSLFLDGARETRGSSLSSSRGRKTASNSSPLAR